jgi:hypothetical protein
LVSFFAEFFNNSLLSTGARKGRKKIVARRAGRATIIDDGCEKRLCAHPHRITLKITLSIIYLIANPTAIRPKGLAAAVQG